jgi:ubiquinone/menaquinone biosynthesis C-methylase UbiE
MMADNERRFDPKQKNGLVSSDRQARWDPGRFLPRFGLKEGLVVLELGSGPGFWTLPLAELVGPQGQVIALDVSEDMLRTLVERRPPPQVRVVRGELPAIELPDASADFIWAAFIYHEVEDSEKLAHEMHRVLRENGRAAVLEWRPEAYGQNGPPRHHRIPSTKLIEELVQAGFHSAGIDWIDKDAYLVKAHRGALQ